VGAVCPHGRLKRELPRRTTMTPRLANVETAALDNPTILANCSTVAM
jgi:hypothetical protein